MSSPDRYVTVPGGPLKKVQVQRIHPQNGVVFETEVDYSYRQFVVDLFQRQGGQIVERIGDHFQAADLRRKMLAASEKPGSTYRVTDAEHRALNPSMLKPPVEPGIMWADGFEDFTRPWVDAPSKDPAGAAAAPQDDAKPMPDNAA